MSSICDGASVVVDGTGGIGDQFTDPFHYLRVKDAITGPVNPFRCQHLGLDSSDRHWSNRPKGDSDVSSRPVYN